jgi:phospholipase/carboxylesterase
MASTMNRRTFLAAGAAAALAGLPSAARAQDAVTPGTHDLKLGDGDRDGLLFVPRSYKPGVPTPLMVMLHGAGNSARGVATYTFPLAEEFGVLVVAPDSRDEATWDALLHGFGPDIEFIGRALSQTRSQCNVDPKKMWLAGHSDGASYALSLGLGTGDTFGYVAAFSPGVMQPAEVHGKPRIFISHGLSDPIMPIEVTSRRFVPRLKNLGYDVTYREYEGRHGVTTAIVREAFEWFLKS